MKNSFGILSLAVLCMVVLGMVSTASAQGRGSGRGHGGPPAGSQGMGQPGGIGVDKGLGISSERSVGRADTGRETASDRSNRRSDAGLDRARLRSDNARRANEELRAHPYMAARLHTTANDLRNGYQAALLTNPNLKFGQYVAATRLGRNLGSRHPNITRDAILAGLANGKSIGRTLQNLGLSEQSANAAKKQAEREIREAKKG